MNSRRSFRIYAWGVLLYHVLIVILWGAYVRASGSGAGCGAHWPLCNGVAIPHSPTVATLIEFSHRLTSGLALLLAVALLGWAYRSFPAGHMVRRAAWAAIFFELMEALIGAALVLLGQVAKDTSLGRGVTLSVHLINTLLLIAALAVAAWAGSHDRLERRPGSTAFRVPFAVAAVAILLLGVSGAITALGDTLFQTTSLSAGFRQDAAVDAHPFIRYRIWHPAIAVTVSLTLTLLCYRVARANVNTRATQYAYGVAGLLLLQLGVGVINLALLAPIPLQLIHLLIADSLWIAFVLLGAEAFFQTSDTSRNRLEKKASPALAPA